MVAPLYTLVRQSDASRRERSPSTNALGFVLSVSEGRSFASQGQNERPRESTDKTHAKLLLNEREIYDRFI
jgi:hypothetical protein